MQTQCLDKYAMYDQAFQKPEAYVAFLDRVYVECNGRMPTTLREDFCGTAAIACQWVRGRAECRAVAVDIDPEPLAWRRAHLHILAPDQRHRLQIVESDVCSVEALSADMILAPNSSICLINTRPQLIAYLLRCRAMLNNCGMFIADVYAGPGSQTTGADLIICDGFTCVWEQVSFDPHTHEAHNRIHFKRPNGTRLLDAFKYMMRLWTPVELRDALLESGFARVSSVVNPTGGPPSTTCSSICREQIGTEDCWDAFIVGYAE